MKNETIRQAAAEKGIRLWQVAEALGVTDSTFSRWLRRELAPEKAGEVLAVIDRLAAKM